MIWLLGEMTKVYLLWQYVNWEKLNLNVNKLKAFEMEKKKRAHTVLLYSLWFVFHM